MADYKIPNLCGSSVKFNAIQSKFDTMISNAIDGLDADASTLSSTMNTDNTSLVANNKAMMTELSASPTTASPPAAEVLQAEADSEKEINYQSSVSAVGVVVVIVAIWRRGRRRRIKTPQPDTSFAPKNDT